jgi:hypothetical protein
MSDPNTNRDAEHALEPSAGAEPPSPVRPENRYEETDASFRAVTIVAIVGCVIGAVVFVAVRGFYWAALESQPPAPATTFTAPEKPTEQLPPEPRLELLDRQQKTPASNVSRWERGEEKSLETYGSSDEKGFVRIPLKEAMHIVVGQLPARKAADQPKFPDKGLIDAGESNSGRIFRGGSP